MKILILSDLHLEFAPFIPVTEDYDVAILAGDIHTRESPEHLFKKRLVYVPGNHEYYGHVYQERRRELRDLEITVLDRDQYILGLNNECVRILGCTLWTDFELPVRTRRGYESNPNKAMDKALLMYDYKAIRFPERLLVPQDTLHIHQKDATWLLAELRRPFDGKTIVVTHHGPSSQSVHPKYDANWLNPSFSSELSDDFFEVPALWVHGHTHSSLDYKRGNTRVICNPRGYPVGAGEFENPDFNPGLVVEI